MNSKNIHDKPKNISKEVKDEFGNSSGLQQWNLFSEVIMEHI